MAHDWKRDLQKKAFLWVAATGKIGSQEQHQVQGVTWVISSGEKVETHYLLLLLLEFSHPFLFSLEGWLWSQAPEMRGRRDAICVFHLPSPTPTEICSASTRVGLKQGERLALAFSLFKCGNPHTLLRTSRTNQVSLNVWSGAGTTRIIGWLFLQPSIQSLS